MPIINVVKFEGAANVLAWKHPNKELTTGTRLMVNDSQEAILFKDGVPCDRFTGGTWVLETKNIPVLQRIVNLPSGGVSRFSAEVWFVNKQTNLDVKWGTLNPVEVLDPLYGVVFPVRANGQFGIRVEDSALLLKKIVGTMKLFTAEDVTKYFRGIYLNRISDAIAGFMVHRKITAFQLPAYLRDLSAYAEEQTAPVMAEYGLELVNFNVNCINVDKTAPQYSAIQNIGLDRYAQDTLNYTYQEKRKLDIQEGLAKNAAVTVGGAGAYGVNGVAGTAVQTATALVGLELGKEMARQLFPEDEQAVPERKTPDMENDFKFCPKCGEKIEKNYAFCPYCGEKL